MNNYQTVLTFIKKYEIIIASGVLLLCSVILLFKFAIPNFAKANRVFKDQQVLKKRLSTLAKKDASLSLLDKQYYTDSYQKIRRVLPATTDYYSLFTSLDDLQTKTGITVLKSDFQLGTISSASGKFVRAKGTNAFAIPITVEVSGTLPQLTAFMTGLSDLSERLITLDSIALTFKDNGMMQARFTGNAYFYSQPAALGSLESPLPQIPTQNEAILSQIAQTAPVIADETTLEEIPVGKKNLFN